MFTVSELRTRGFGSSFCILINFFDVKITFLKHDIKDLIMIEKLEPRTVDLKPTEIGHVDRAIMHTDDIKIIVRKDKTSVILKNDFGFIFLLQLFSSHT